MTNTKNEGIDKALQEKIANVCHELTYGRLAEHVADVRMFRYAKQIIQEVQKDTRKHDLTELEKKKKLGCYDNTDTWSDCIEWDDIRAVLEGK